MRRRALRGHSAAANPGAEPCHRGDLGDRPRRHGPRLGVRSRPAWTSPTRRPHSWPTPRKLAGPASPSRDSATTASRAPGQADDEHLGRRRPGAGGSACETPFDSGPYEQAARVFRQHGYTSQAELILINQRRRIRKITPGRGRRLVEPCTARPSATVPALARTLVLLILLILVTASLELPGNQGGDAGDHILWNRLHHPRSAARPSLRTPPEPPQRHPRVTGAGQPGPLRKRPGPLPQPGLYAIDTVIPLISLDQRSTWYPDPHVRVRDTNGMGAQHRRDAGLATVLDLRPIPRPPGSQQPMKANEG